MPESFKSSEEISQPEHIETLTTADILEQFKNNSEAQKQIFGKKLTSKEFKKRFDRGVSAKDIGEIAKAIGLKMASLEDLGITMPESSEMVEEEKPGQALAEKLMKEINTLQASRKLETLSMDELEKVRDKYIEVKHALGLEEGAATGLVLQAKNEKGDPIEFNFKEIKSKVVDFYGRNGMEELADAIEGAKIILTEEQKRAIVEIVKKEGFDSVWIFPGNEMMQENSVKIKKGTEKAMDGLAPNQQYKEKDKSGEPMGTYLSDIIKPEFLSGKIKNNNRPNKPYVFLYKSNLETDEETRRPLDGLGGEEGEEGEEVKKVDNSAENLRKYFGKRGIKGFTQQEYLVLQRVITENNKEGENPHPDSSYYSWLLDSELGSDSSGPGRVLYAAWYPDTQQVRVHSNTPDNSYLNIGARSSAIFEIL